MIVPAPVKAAQYVRMSTEDQIYSTANQTAAIADYAALHNLEIVRTYADEGRSGLQLKGRPALQEMLQDVLSGKPGYQMILVFDVSRWGRFQDADESAHYEFVCKRSGVHIHYCAEAFSNDGSAASAIMKNVRRIMAGEFSRDLSQKVWAGQSRLVSLGYKMGGKAGYGLRRLLVDRDGVAKQVLQEGDHKSITTDRVVLIPGPAEEVAVVRRIFALAKEGLNFQAIADCLNADGIAAPVAAKWCNGSIRAIVQAERYIGVNVYNKRSMKLGSNFTYNPRSEWIRCERAFEPLISAETFRSIQRQQRYCRPHYTDEALLDHLKRLLDIKGHLTKGLIDAASPPASKTYGARFGSLRNAYARVGYDPWSREKFGVDAKICNGFLHEIRQVLTQAGKRVSLTTTSRLLTVDGRVVVAPRLYTMCPGNMWKVRFSPSPDVDLVLAGLLNDGVRQQAYLFPIRMFGRSYPIKISGECDRLAPFRVPTLSWLPEMIGWLAG
ncbi:hypothetical protein HY78_18575 [Rhizorhabdus wittichii DC-6]|nr:hypothetical protein HY78_18575 [Rhizorhabdus wittichii DC-6]